MALARYRMLRGKRPEGDPMADGIRQDTRKHTRHPLRPPADAVARYLEAPSEKAWGILARAYLATIKERFAADRAPFDAIADLARDGDVYLGCSCPTQKNPDVRHCHTVLALRFMAERFPDLTVVFPTASE